MKILVIEDDEKKWRAISGHLAERNVNLVDVIRVKTMAEFAAKLHEDIGLFVIDLKVPGHTEAAPAHNGTAILEAILMAGKNDALLLAISSYPSDFPRIRAAFEARGCILTDYSDKRAWKATFDHLLVQLKKRVSFDFLLFCALHEERAPFITLLEGRQVNRSGVDCFDVELSGKKGSIILLPQMGLVNAAVTAGLCIDRFKPSVVGMNGICGGFKKKATLGQLIVSSMAYEYQTGKWASDGFKQEPYQVPTDHQTITKLKMLLGTPGLMTHLQKGFRGKRPERAQKPKDGIFTSGSAVIADKKHIGQIATYHRKVNALDMEVFAVQRAAELSPHKPVCICAKTVVDLGDSRKNDDLHPYGSYISAKFLIKAIENHFVDV